MEYNYSGTVNCLPLSIFQRTLRFVKLRRSILECSLYLGTTGSTKSNKKTFPNVIECELNCKDGDGPIFFFF